MSGDTNHLESVRRWFDRPLWKMELRDADRYFGTVLRSVSAAMRAERAQVLVTSCAPSAADGYAIPPAEIHHQVSEHLFVSS